MKSVKLFFNGFVAGFRKFGHAFATFVNFILLVIVYIIGIGLTSLIAKIFGKHFLNLKKKKRPTYWEDKNLSKEPIENYYRQF